MGVEKIHIGKMDRRIDINIRVKTKTDIGSETYINTNVATVWARRESIISIEDIEDKIVAVNSYNYTIRYHPDIAGQIIQNLYITDDGQQFDIYGVDPIGRQRFLKLKATRRE